MSKILNELLIVEPYALLIKIFFLNFTTEVLSIQSVDCAEVNLLMS